MGDIDVLQIILIVLAVVGVWCLVEVAFTIRRARKAVKSASQAVEEVRKGVTQTIDQAQPLISNIDATIKEVRPVIAHVDEVVTQARPAAADVAPLLQKTSGAIEALSGDLERMDAILTDVSRLTGTATTATAAVGAATTGILEKVRGRIGHRDGDVLSLAEGVEVPAGEEPSELSEVTPAPASKVISADRGYFTYPDAPDASESVSA